MTYLIISINNIPTINLNCIFILIVTKSVEKECNRILLKVQMFLQNNTLINFIMIAIILL